MTRLTRRSVLEGIVATGVGLTFAGPAAAGEQARYVVTGSRRGVENRLENTSFAVQHALAGGRVCLVVGPEDDREELERVGGVEEVARDLRFEFEEPAVEESGPESEHSGTGLSPLQWDKQVTEAFEAHETATGEGTRLAIIDTGIDHDHPDLAPNVDPDEGRLFRYGDVSSDTQDVYGHGTHVAGIAAADAESGADGYGAGVVGTAPDAELVSLRVFYYDDVDGDGEQELTTTSADILSAIDHAGDIGADAANMSIGTPPLPPQYNRTGIRVAYERVIQHATRRGTVVVASAGNSAANLQQGGYFTVPNSTAGAMSVSATGPNDPDLGAGRLNVRRTVESR